MTYEKYVSNAVISKNYMKRTKSISLKHRMLWGGGKHTLFLHYRKIKICRGTLSFTPLAEIKSYSRHLLLQLRKLLQIAAWK